MKKGAEMDFVLRRRWALACLAGLFAIAGCSSDHQEGPGPATSSAEPSYVASPSDPGAGISSSSGSPWTAPPVSSSSPPSNQDAFAREQEERSLAGQKDDLLVEGYLVAARKFIGVSDYESAERAALQALEVRPTDRAAIDLLRQIRTLQGQPVDSQEELAQWVLAKRKLVRQQQVALVNDHFTRATQAFNRGDFDESRVELEQADLRMKFDPWQTDFGALSQEVPQLLAVVQRRVEQAKKSNDEEAAKQAYDAVVAEEERRRQREMEEVRLLMIEGIEAFKRQDFDNAEAMADKVLRKDPSMTKARELKEWSRQARHGAWRESYYDQRREEFQSWLEGIRESQIPYTQLLRWMNPDKWAKLSTLRKRGDVIDVAQEDSDSVRSIKAKLANETITLDYGVEPTSFLNVVNYIRTTQGINIVVANEVRTEKGEEPVRLTLVNQNLGTALKTILDNLSLAHTFQNDVLFITTKDKALGTPYPRVYEVRDLTITLPNFKAPNLNLRPGPAGETATRAIWGEDKDPTTETTIDRLVELVRDNVEKSTWETPGFSLAPSSGQIVATTVPEIHKKIEDFLADLRRFTKLTVHVEARFISLRKGFLQDVGVDWRGTGGQGPGALALLDDITNAGVYNASAGTDNGQPGLPAAGSLSPAAGAFYNVGGNGDLRGRTEGIFNRALGGALLSSSGGAAIQFGLVDDTNLNILLKAVEKSIDNTLVNAPRLTIFNNQRANLTLVNQVSYVKDYDVEVAQTAFIADPLVDVVQDGLTLDVRPVVSHDRKYVMLEVQPTVATLVRPIRTFESNLSGLTTAVVIELPEIRYSQAKTTVRVPDGGYVVIGGLKHVTTVDRRSEIPILSDIPLISFLFSRKGRSDEIRDLIIVLHVRILDLTEAEANLAN